MKVSGVDYVDEPTTHDDLLHRAAPGRLPRPGPRPGGDAERPGRAAPAVGPRDEARLTGGIGSCGRELCCSTFLVDFEPVSVRMAKDQDLPLNPLRISGACGRLMCCLKYEHPLYQDFAAEAPAVGEQVETPDGVGTSSATTSRPSRSWSGWPRTAAAPPARWRRVCGSRKAYEAKYGDAGQGNAGPGGTAAGGTAAGEAG